MSTKPLHICDYLKKKLLQTSPTFFTQRQQVYLLPMSIIMKEMLNFSLWMAITGSFKNMGMKKPIIPNRNLRTS